MGTRVAKLRAEQKRALRLAVIGFAIVAIIAYPSLIAAKLVWGLPNLAWWRIALAPVSPFTLVVLPMWLSLRHELSAAARQFDDLA